MCSFLILNYTISKDIIKKVNKILQLRGPDNTNILELSVQNYTFIHNLLHITGKKTIQPFYDRQHSIICLYNGEIYNYNEFGKYNSDGECLIPLYLKYQEDFINYLDGEYSICLFDFKKNKFYLATDTFRTKPIYYSIKNDKIGISSYFSPLKQLNFKDIGFFSITSEISSLR